MLRSNGTTAGTASISWAALIALALAGAGCGQGSASKATFERIYTVTGPIRLEVYGTSGNVQITGSTDNQVHIRGDVYARGIFGDPGKRALQIAENPPIEQKPDIIRLGKEMRGFSNTSISYTISVPRATEVQTNVVSGSQSVRDVQGPVRIESVSGSVEVSHVDRGASITTVSGSIEAGDLGDDLRASSSSGSIEVGRAKGDVRIRSTSGTLTVTGPGARVEAATSSGSVEISGAGNDVTASTVSGRVQVQGNPSGNSYWNLKTTSGSVNVAVPPSSNFHLSAQAVSGEIRTGIPILIEDQDKHSLRARVGNAGGRVEIHTVSGGIRVEPAS